MKSQLKYAINYLGDAFLQFSRNGRWGTCADCPRDSSQHVYPEFCVNTDRQDHQLTVDGLAEQWKIAAKPAGPNVTVVIDGGEYDDAWIADVETRRLYIIERSHHSRPGRWEPVGRFVAGSAWRDGRPVDDETMIEEAQGYHKKFPPFLARVRCPNGLIIEPSNTKS